MGAKARPHIEPFDIGRDGGQIGAGTVQAPIECFQLAAKAYAERYGGH